MPVNNTMQAILFFCNICMFLEISIQLELDPIRWNREIYHKTKLCLSQILIFLRIGFVLHNFRYVKVKIQVTDIVGTGLYELATMQVRLDAKLKNDAGNVSALSTDTLGTIVNFNKEFIDVQSVTISPSGTTPIIPVYDIKDAFVSGTYSIVSNVCTVNITNHGLITGQNTKLFFDDADKTDVYIITSYTTNSFTVALTTADTTGGCSMYPQSFRVYLFNNSGTRVSSTTSWSIKGY